MLYHEYRLTLLVSDKDIVMNAMKDLGIKPLRETSGYVMMFVSVLGERNLVALMMILAERVHMVEEIIAPYAQPNLMRLYPPR